jgi:ABC-type polysaccharide/polyol phosphate export permease
VKFIIQAALLVWFYVTPVAYPKHLLKGLAGVADLNPMTGVAALFQLAAVGSHDWARPVIISSVTTVVLVILAIEVQRRRDRLFVDLL